MRIGVHDDYKDYLQDVLEDILSSGNAKVEGKGWTKVGSDWEVVISFPSDDDEDSWSEKFEETESFPITHLGQRSVQDWGHEEWDLGKKVEAFTKVMSSATSERWMYLTVPELKKRRWGSDGPKDDEVILFPEDWSDSWAQTQSFLSKLNGFLKKTGFTSADGRFVRGAVSGTQYIAFKKDFIVGWYEKQR